MSDKPAIEEVALSWALRTVDPAFDDWDGLLTWIAGDPERNRAYNLAMAVVSHPEAQPDGFGSIERPVADNDIEPLSSGNRWWLGGAAVAALAASIAGLMVFGQVDREPAYQVIETPPGKPRAIALKDHSLIEIGGGSRILLDGSRPRWARVDYGRVVFTVKHDHAAPYKIEAGRLEIVDIGTSFEIAQDEPSTRIAVSEGQVLVDPEGLRLPLEQGRAARLDRSGNVTLERVSPASVGQWRRTHMRYEDASIRLVASDLSTAMGLRVEVERSAEDRRFTGTINPSTLRDKPDAAAALLNVRVVVTSKGWELHSP